MELIRYTYTSYQTVFLENRTRERPAKNDPDDGEEHPEGA